MRDVPRALVPRIKDRTVNISMHVLENASERQKNVPPARTVLLGIPKTASTLSIRKFQQIVSVEEARNFNQFHRILWKHGKKETSDSLGQ